MKSWEETGETLYEWKNKKTGAIVRVSPEYEGGIATGDWFVNLPLKDHIGGVLEKFDKQDKAIQFAKKFMEEHPQIPKEKLMRREKVASKLKKLKEEI